ncbi:unnamed protein product [Adineta ricciae]|uniref:TIR domain-containing protein n=1 Tax=Adineta ricciae TaxID=249248 RepID=A0A815W7K8_ADIRI|nr:unnamed protein product [Adineta ricciae]
MTQSNDLTSLLFQLQQLQNSTDYSTISNTIDARFHTKIDELITKWISNENLSADEKSFFDLYSNHLLSPVEYCLFHADETVDISAITGPFRRNLFQKTSTDKLIEAVEYIREEHWNHRDENDVILVYIMKMIDARSYAYRLQIDSLTDMLPRTLYSEIYDSLIHRHGKKYLYNVKSLDKKNEKLVISNRHRFFLGCSTYAVALFPEYQNLLKEAEQTKYIYLLAKYVRVMLKMNNFEKNPNILYCLRGVLALLNNCVPVQNWMHIINKAIANPNDVNAQQANPFNVDLFSLIVKRLLASNIIHDKAVGSSSPTVTSLVDVALIFLNKWFGSAMDRDEDERDAANEEQSELLQLLRSNDDFNDKRNTAQTVFTYINAEYDRLRFMSIAILSSLMSFDDLEKLKRKNGNIWKDIVMLIFHFINRAVVHESKQYKGISFGLLLCYLHRFLTQDGVKKETLPFVSQIVQYARDGELIALKILRRISTDPWTRSELTANTDFDRLINTDTNLFHAESRMHKYIEDIRRNLQPIEYESNQDVEESNDRQAFISYSHKNKDKCDEFHQILTRAGLFTKIWLDRTHVEGNVIDSIVSGIKQSEIVFVLLSDSYCRSDKDNTCRREWEFARTCKKTVCPVFVEESFKRKAYDWVVFLIGSDLYYKFHDENDMKRLVKAIQTSKSKTSSKTEKKTTEKFDSPSLTTDNPSNDRETVDKQPIAQWTRENVQNWCRDNSFDQWREPLSQYSGLDLLELNKVLKKNAYLHRVADSHRIPLLDVIKFRRELRKLVSETTPTPKSAIQKPVTKRPVSKPTVK